jgi:hypothetical protein
MNGERGVGERDVLVKNENDLWTSWIERPSWFVASQPMMKNVVVNA